MDNWKILYLILRQIFLDWPVAFLDRLTFRKIAIYTALLAITIALFHMGMPDASLFTIDAATYDIAIAIVLATARGTARPLLNAAVRLGARMTEIAARRSRMLYRRGVRRARRARTKAGRFFGNDPDDEPDAAWALA